LRATTVTLAMLAIGLPNLACAPVPGEGKVVRIDAEEAIIIWDAAAKRQHFIRRASFQTDAKDFGFLVPTPNQPELSEADDTAFDMLLFMTDPEAILREVERKRVLPLVVPGLTASVLTATRAGALDEWLKRHGYASTPELVDWYKPYIARGWTITAFKIAAGEPRIRTRAVRMSFETDRPFFPYREPANQRESAKSNATRLLRIYFVSSGRFAGALGEQGAWAGRTAWSAPMPPGNQQQLMQKAKVRSVDATLWVTRFDDSSSPRPGTDDVFFARARDQSPITSFALVDRSGQWILIGAVMVALAFVGYLLQQKKKSDG